MTQTAGHVKAWQETGGTLKLGNWGMSDKRRVYKGVKPDMDGTVPWHYSWACGAERERLPEAGGGSLWEGSPDDPFGAGMKQTQAAEEDAS